MRKYLFLGVMGSALAVHGCGWIGDGDDGALASLNAPGLGTQAGDATLADLSGQSIFTRYAVAQDGDTAIVGPGTQDLSVAIADGQAASVSGTAGGVPINVDLAANEAAALDYVTFGAFASGADGLTPVAFATGLETGNLSIPSNGTFRFNGSTVGAGTLAGTAFDIRGNAEVVADFLDDEVNVFFDEMVATTDAGSFVFSNLASEEDMGITRSPLNGGTYSGSISATTDSAFATDGTSGGIEGAFFGPDAGETGGVWTLNSPDLNVTGSFGAER